MSITASCGHQLAEDEGPDGMGWPLATRGFSREGTPAVIHGVYCTACRERALAEQGYVLSNDTEEMAWLNFDPESLTVVGEVREPAPSYGIWKVWDGNPLDGDEDFAPRCLGTYQGFVDDIALTVVWSDRDIMYFQRVDASINDEVQVIAAPPALEDLDEDAVGLNVIVGDGLLADTKEAIQPFFAGRPAFVRFSSWGNCIALFSTATEYGASLQDERTQLQAVFNKLTPADIELLRAHGLKPD